MGHDWIRGVLKIPDFGSPVAQNVNVSPNAGLTTLSDLMGLQQKQIAISQAQQNLQTGVAVQQQQQAQAQLQQQQMGERQILQGALKSGKDDQGNSLIDPSTGQVDPNALASFANRRLPLTGPGVVQGIIKTQSDQIGLQSSAQKLSMEQRQMLQGPLQALNLDPSDDNIANARSTIGGLVQQNPGMAKTASYVNSFIDHIASTQDPRQRSHMANTLSAMIQGGATVETQLRAGTMDTGATIQAGTVAPPAAGGGFTPTTTTAKGVAPGIVMDLQGQPHYVGGVSGLGGGGVGGQRSAFPTPQQVQARTANTAAMTDHFGALNASAGSLPLVTGLTKTIEGLAPEAFTGPGGDKKQYLAGLLRSFHIDATGDAQTDTNLLNKAIAQLNISTPAGTDAARALVEAGQPNSKMDPQAIKEAAGTIRGQVLMNTAERNFLQTSARLSNGGAGDPVAYQQGRQMFEQNADPRIWQYEDLAKSNPAGAKAFIAKQPDKADLIRRTAALEQMGFFR